MPIYTYKCLLCHRESDHIEKVDEGRQDKRCSDPDCFGTAVHVVSSRGTVLSDTPTWLNGHVQAALLDTDSKSFRPIETRTQLKQHLKDKGLMESPGSGPRWV